MDVATKPRHQLIENIETVVRRQHADQIYKYLGRITAEGHFWIGRKNPRPGDLDRNAPSAKAFDWTWKNLNRGIFNDQLEIWHESKCGRCGRKLTVPASIASGFGPECINHI